MGNERSNWIRGAFKKHYEEKEHFILIEHRLYGGWIQSLNIKFGNLLESALSYFFLSLPELGFRIYEIRGDKKRSSNRAVERKGKLFVLK